MQVEIWSDIACPWCFVGKRRFERALEQYEGRDDVTVTWRSFELDPSAPAERAGGAAEHIARKYGMSVEQAAASQAQMTEMAAADGIAFRFDLQRGGNTFDGHRLVQLAAFHGVQDAMKERLLQAYHGEGELISDHATLRRLAGDVGLPPDEVDELLAGDRFGEEVRDDQRTAIGLGISAVPFFAVDRRFGAAGAQDPEVLLHLLRRAAVVSDPSADRTASR